MTDITTYPMIDDFDTTLAQAWDGAVGTVYLNDAVGITLPSSTTTYIVVNPWKSTMQVAKINAVNNTLKTATVSSTTVDKGAWVAYTQQSHPVGSVVRISTNYAFWKDIIDSVNTKVNTNDDDIAQGKFADATARDAYFTSPVNGNSAYLTAEGKRTDYVAGSWADRDQGILTANASTTVAGKVEQSTTAQNTAWTATGETWAPLFSTPADLATTIQSWSWVYCASATGSDTYTANLTPSLTAYTTGMLLPCKFTTTNTGACSININSLWAKNIKTLDGNDPQTWVIRANGTALLMYDGTNFVLQSEDFATDTVKWIVEMATDAEATTGTDATRYINSKQAKDNYANTSSYVTDVRWTTWTWVAIPHWLWKKPSIITVMFKDTTTGTVWQGTCDTASLNQSCTYQANNIWVDLISWKFINPNTLNATVTAVDATNITVTRAWAGTVVYYIYSKA